MAISPNTYVEINDLNISEKDLIYLSNETTATSVNYTNIKRAVFRAEGLITSKIGVKLTIPLLEAYKTEMLIGWVSDLVTYYLWQKKDRAIPDDVKEARDITLSQLDDFIDGRLVLGIASATEETAKKTEGRTVTLVRGE
jgi:phage gp36-like protein